MSTRVCFAILVLCFNSVADRKLVLDLGPQACPYTNFCHTDASKIRPNNTVLVPCCFPCSCDDECWEFDNCCPDKELLDVPRHLMVPCIDSYVKWRPDKSNPYIGFYKVIDSCPISEDRPNLEPKCGRQNKTTLEDLIWVSDETGKIYQNIHCAKCHGIKEPIMWQLQTMCFDIMKAKLDNFTETLLSKRCYTINTIPENLQRITNKYRCISPQKFIYSSCNETGMMTSYNPAVEIACEQSTWPYIVGLQLAKNVFCVICNRELPKVSADGLCFFAHGKEEKPTYTFLLDYTTLPADMIEKESNCGSDETFDEFMIISGFPLKRNSSVERLAQLLFSKYNFEGFCRLLLCPIGTAPFYGRCKQLVSKMNGYIVNVQFYLDIVRNQTSLFTDYENDTIWNKIYAQFIELADLNSNCEICQKIIDLVENSTSDLILVVTFKFSSECDYSLALENVANMRGKLIEIHFNRAVVLTLLVQYDKQPSKLYKQARLQTVLYHNPSQCVPSHTLLFEDIICPRVMLNNTEIESLSHTENSQKEIFASFFKGNGTEQNEKRVSVCLDNYISEMSLNQAQSSSDKRCVQMMLTEAMVFLVTRVNLNK